MALAETLEPKVIEHSVETRDAGVQAIDPNNVHAFRAGPFNLSRWTRINITGLNLPRNPFCALTQIRFPGNSTLSVSDNFATTVAVMNRSRLEVNVWRVDANADPSIDYIVDFMIVTN